MNQGQHTSNSGTSNLGRNPFLHASLLSASKGTESRSTSVWEDARLHGRSIATISRERGMGLNVAFSIVVQQAADQIKEAFGRGYIKGYKEGREAKPALAPYRSKLSVMKPPASETFSLPKAA